MLYSSPQIAKTDRNFFRSNVEHHSKQPGIFDLPEFMYSPGESRGYQIFKETFDGVSAIQVDSDNSSPLFSF
jgi:hypothetical protein